MTVGDGELLGVGAADFVAADFVAADTGQVTAEVPVSYGCADAAGLGPAGPVAVAGPVVVAGTAVPDARGVTSVALDRVPTTTGSVLVTHLPVATGCGCPLLDVAAAPGAPGDPLAPVCPLDAALNAGAALPPTVGVPLPSVPALTCCDPLSPFSAALAWRITCRKGWMPSVMAAIAAIPASTTASRSDPSPHRGKLLRRDRGPRSPESLDSEVGQAQCPRQDQYRTRSTTPKRTLSSQGRGGRSPIRARILSSPSVPGSTPLAASDKARRSASSRPSSSGEVMTSLTCPPRHYVSCSRTDLSAAIARAVWLFTAPRLIPIAVAMSASEKSP